MVKREKTNIIVIEYKGFVTYLMNSCLHVLLFILCDPGRANRQI